MTSKPQLSVQEALAEVLACVAPLPARRLPIGEALGRVLAEEVRSAEDLPPFANSAMDGFAVRVADVAGASRDTPVRLKVLADAPAGATVACVIAPGTTVRIMTGAELPPGTEAVVPVEHTASKADAVDIFRPVRMGGNLRWPGEDVRAGEVVIRKGTTLRPSEIGLMAALGQVEATILPAPRVAVLTTGAELVEAASPLGPGQIRDANIYALCAQVRAAGCEAIAFPRVADTAEAVRSALASACAMSEVVLTNGGVSAGDYDFVKQTLEGMGARQVFCQVKQKPGRPLTFWMLDGKPIFGLPGNPVAAMVCFEMYVRPALRRILGHSRLFRPRTLAVLAEGYRKDPGDPRIHFLRVHAFQEEGHWLASSTGHQGSGILSSMTKANAIAEIPADAGCLQAGETVSLHLTDLPEDH